jgi:hypothetical protein
VQQAVVNAQRKDKVGLPSSYTALRVLQRGTDGAMGQFGAQWAARGAVKVIAAPITALVPLTLPYLCPSASRTSTTVLERISLQLYHLIVSFRDDKPFKHEVET